MKTFTISGLPAMLLLAVFVHAQDFMEQSNSARLIPPSRDEVSPKSAKRHRFLPRGLEEYRGKVETDDFPKEALRSDEDSLNEREPAPRLHKSEERWETPLRERGVLDTSSPIEPNPFLAAQQTHKASADMQAAWMRHYGSGLVPACDIATAITSDQLGNVYVTGYSTNRPFGFDYFTTTYNAAGVEVWSARYHGVENCDDRAFAIAVDTSGNVYVTGYSYDAETSYDYATIKYNSAGVEQWVARYNGPGNFDDYAIALAVDAAGNVYITGRSWGSGTQYDYATVKYNSKGVEQWVTRFNGPGNADDVVYALALDDSGNVLVTGYSYGMGTGYDYATIKYDSVGAEQWVTRYNGEGNSEFADGAFDLAIDRAGNVYVTGAAYGSLTSYDYATVKYNPAGVEQWVATYNGPGKPPEDFASTLAVDDSGNVYVTGYSGSRTSIADYATIKYDSMGVQKWVARYDGPREADDIPTNIALDFAGNIYVTGYSGNHSKYDYATIKYDNAGNQKWIARYDGPGNRADRAYALAIDAAGNVNVTGYSYGEGTNYDYATVTYNSAGTQQWVNRYNGPGNSDDHATAIAADEAGNVYVTGYSDNAETKYDYATVKYDSAGTVQWVAHYNGPGNRSDKPCALAVDAAGNVYVTGYSDDVKTDYDYVTVKYNFTGVEQWVARYNGPKNRSDEAAAIAVDPAGNVYVTGLSAGSDTGNDYATIKYNSTGGEEWVVRYNGAGNSADNATALAIDSAGNVYVTGYSRSLTSFDYATIKYDSAGTQQWVARYDGPGNLDDSAIAIAIDPGGNVYVTGSSDDADGGSDYVTIKYNSAGEEEWVARYNGPENSSDNAVALAVDPAGSIYVTGWSSGSAYATVKYNSAGEEQWAARYIGPVNDFNFASALALDPAGDIYVTGYGVGSGTHGDYATIKYNSTGAEQWVARSDGPGHPDDYAKAIAVDHSGNLYVTGSSYEANSSWTVYTTIKYNKASILTSVKTVADELPASFELGSNYPNPFNPETTIQYAIQAPIADGVHVTLRIYNVQGQLVRTLVDEQQSPGQYRVVWDGKNNASIRVSSGVYLYTINAGNFKAAKKMAIFK